MKIISLCFKKYDFKIKKVSDNYKIFDEIRKKYVVLTPEEWVRQNIIRYLIEEKNYPATLFAVETGILYNNLNKRIDILIYNKDFNPWMIIECKSETVELTNEVLEQAKRYFFQS